MVAAIRTFDLCREVRRVGASFESALVEDGRDSDAPGARPGDRGVTARNLSLTLPYHLIEGFPFDGDLGAARAMSRGNAFGAAHFLAQDRFLDGDESLSPRGSGFSDLCLVRFIREYAGLFDGESDFWPLLERYLREYAQSLAWERDVLWSSGGARCVDEDSLDQTLERLGNKMSPLKSTVAAVSLLSGSDELLSKGERLIAAYHAGYQLADDLLDLSRDARLRRWSVPLRLASGAGEPEAVVKGLDDEDLLGLVVRTGTYARVTGLVRERYEETVEIAVELGLSALADYVREALGATVEMSVWVTRRFLLLSKAAHAGPTEQPTEPPAGAHAHPHSFSVRGRDFVVDPASCLFFEADEVASDVLTWMRSGSSADALKVLRLDHGGAAVDEARHELSSVAAEATPLCGAAERPTSVTPTNIVSLALDVTSRCNLACDYCYLRGGENGGGRSGDGGRGAVRHGVEDMTPETAFACLEFLLEEASTDGAASLVFFGGEPLLRSDLVLDVARRARREADQRGVRLDMHLTTNGTMLTPDIGSALHESGVTVLVSIDGPAGAHDGHRKLRNGGGSHDVIVRNLASLPEGVAASARVTLTEESAPLGETVSHLSALGFATVHLSPASGAPVSVGLSRRLLPEFEDLAARELESMLAGGRPVVGNFTRAMRALATGRPRALPCGAGARYLCAAPDGALYLCHRFAGDARFAVGSAFAGVDRRAVARLLNALRRDTAECSGCWARFMCGGPCLHDLSAGAGEGRPDPMRCELSKRVYELAMWMYASLDPDARRALGAGQVPPPWDPGEA